MKHKSVLKNEIADLLKVNPDGNYVDLTLGGGGHSLDIFSRLSTGKLIAFDVDKSAINKFKKRPKEVEPNAEIKDKASNLTEISLDNKKLFLIQDNFENIEYWLDELNMDSVEGVIADLGWSSEQLGNISGLSFENPGEELDMRMNQDMNVKASDLLNVLGKKELGIMFSQYADIYGHKNNKLVKEINNFRKKQIFKNTGDLLKVIKKAFGANVDNSLKARVFQALRIAVNREFDILKSALPKIYKRITRNGRFLIITFHSGEEKLVREFVAEKLENKEVELLTKYTDKFYLRPSVDELMENLSARSAKLWGIEKVGKDE